MKVLYIYRPVQKYRGYLKSIEGKMNPSHLCTLTLRHNSIDSNKPFVLLTAQTFSINKLIEEI